VPQLAAAESCGSSTARLGRERQLAVAAPRLERSRAPARRQGARLRTWARSAARDRRGRRARQARPAPGGRSRRAR
jgi:hypothetical protein